MATDQLEGARARLPDGRVGTIDQVHRFDGLEDGGTAVIVTDGPDTAEVVIGLPKAEAAVRAARIDPDVDDVDGPPGGASA